MAAVHHIMLSRLLLLAAVVHFWPKPSRHQPVISEVTSSCCSTNRSDLGAYALVACLHSSDHFYSTMRSHHHSSASQERESLSLSWPTLRCDRFKKLTLMNTTITDPEAVLIHCISVSTLALIRDEFEADMRHDITLIIKVKFSTGYYLKNWQSRLLCLLSQYCPIIAFHPDIHRNRFIN